MATTRIEKDISIEEAFIFAAADGELETVQRYVEIQEVNINAEDKVSGCTPLYAAAENGHLHVVIYLVDKGADKNKYENKGNTPLHGATFHGHMHVVQYLLQVGANANKANDQGKTFYRLARLAGAKKMDNNKCYDLVEKDHFRLWFDMIQDGFLSILARHLLQLFPEQLLNLIHPSTGDTPLHMAGKHGRLAYGLDMFAFLLSNQGNSAMLNNGECMCDDRIVLAIHHTHPCSLSHPHMSFLTPFTTHLYTTHSLCTPPFSAPLLQGRS